MILGPFSLFVVRCLILIVWAEQCGLHLPQQPRIHVQKRGLSRFELKHKVTPFASQIQRQFNHCSPEILRAVQIGFVSLGLHQRHCTVQSRLEGFQRADVILPWGCCREDAVQMHSDDVLTLSETVLQRLQGLLVEVAVVEHAGNRLLGLSRHC